MLSIGGEGVLEHGTYAFVHHVRRNEQLHCNVQYSETTALALIPRFRLTKIGRHSATRHVLWALNPPKMRLQLTALPSPFTGYGGSLLGGGKREGKGRKEGEEKERKERARKDGRKQKALPTRNKYLVTALYLAEG